MKVAALVSGGVDSSVIVPLLKEQGYEPVIFYIKIGMEDRAGFVDCPSEEDIEITTYIAKRFGLRMEVVDLQREYWDRVVAYTLRTVKAGFTPNPDVMCNRLIKFGSFEDRYGHAFDQIATGHYASVVETDNGKMLATARDANKDQTYFLSNITRKQLNKLMFPLGMLEKSQVRKLAADLKLPSANRPDSQGICFLGKINYNDFIKKYVGEAPGLIKEWESDKVLGEHKGIWFHTIGQRKGLGLSQGPWFVVAKNVAEKTIYVSQGYDPLAQYRKQIPLENLHLINPEYPLKPGDEICFKIRHQPEFSRGILVNKAGKYHIASEKQISGVAPGQFAALYSKDEKYCLGSGVIASDHPGHEGR